MDTRVVVVSWFERAVACSDLVRCSGCAFHELHIALVVVEVEECERFVRQHQRCAAVDYVVDKHFALS